MGRGSTLNLATFSAWMTEQRYSKRTRSVYLQYVRRAADHLNRQGTTLRGASAGQLREWWSTLPRSASSRNLARHALMAYYRSVGRKFGQPANEIPRVPAPMGLPRPVTEDVFRLMILRSHEMGGRHEIIGALLGYTGCRIGEAVRARWCQFDLAGDDPAWYVQGKGSRRRGPKERRVPVVPELREALIRWRASSPDPEWLFPSTRSATGHVCDSTLRRELHDIADKVAEDARVTPHRWRHSVATIILEHTNDLRALQELLGHASLSTTQIYTKVAGKRLRVIANVLSPSTEEARPLAA